GRGGSSGNAEFAIIRQVDPSLVTITNDHSYNAVTNHPNLVLNGTILNPIGETEITNTFGPITSTTIRGGSSTVYNLWTSPHSSLVQTNILHLVARPRLGAPNPCV